MAKKKDQSLTDRIAALINRVGEKPAPGMDVIKSALVPCLSLAESLEEGAAIRDAETKITVLETALEKSESENGQLQGELESLRAEVEGFRVAQREQQEQERKKDIPPEQFEILSRLPSKHGGEGLTMLQLWREVNLRLDETEIHVDKLQKAGLIDWHDTFNERFYRRSMHGNELVVAKRLAGEEEPKGTTKRKHADLSKPEEIALAVIAGGGSEGVEEAEITTQLAVSPLSTTLVLVTLREKSMVSEVEEATYTATPMWRLQRDGMEYLAERGKL